MPVLALEVCHKQTSNYPPAADSNGNGGIPAAVLSNSLPDEKAVVC
jgi:hypothetical protein